MIFGCNSYTKTNFNKSINQKLNIDVSIFFKLDQESEPIYEYYLEQYSFGSKIVSDIRKTNSFRRVDYFKEDYESKIEITMKGIPPGFSGIFFALLRGFTLFISPDYIHNKYELSISIEERNCPYRTILKIPLEFKEYHFGLSDRNPPNYMNSNQAGEVAQKIVGLYFSSLKPGQTSFCEPTRK